MLDFEMHDLIDKMGEPDLRVAGLRIWVEGYAYPDASAGTDADWLRALSQCVAESADVRCRGVYLDARSIECWCDELEGFAGSGAARLECIEPNLVIGMKAVDRLGHIRLTVEVTADLVTQQHRFHWEIDASYIPGMVRSLKNILTRFPVRSRS